MSSNIEKYIEIRRLNIQTVADRMGVHRNTIHKYIKGKAGIKLETIRKLAGALEVEETDLAYPGKPPEAIVIKPTPEQALQILAEALRTKGPVITDQRLKSLIERWPDLEEHEQNIALSAAGVETEDAESLSSKRSKE